MSPSEEGPVACCVAMALVLAWIREGWFRLFPGRRPVTAMFPAPARRPAPSAAPAVGPVPEAPAVPAVPTPVRTT